MVGVAEHFTLQSMAHAGKLISAQGFLVIINVHTTCLFLTGGSCSLFSVH